MAGVVCGPLEPYLGKREVRSLSELLRAIGYPRNVVTMLSLVGVLESSYHPSCFKAGEILQEVPAEEDVAKERWPTKVLPCSSTTGLSVWDWVASGKRCARR